MGGSGERGFCHILGSPYEIHVLRFLILFFFSVHQPDMAYVNSIYSLMTRIGHMALTSLKEIGTCKLYVPGKRINQIKGAQIISTIKVM